MLHFVQYNTVVQLAPGYVYMSECNSAQSGDDRSGGAMCEEDVETKSELRLDMVYLLYSVYIHWDEEGEVFLGQVLAIKV